MSGSRCRSTTANWIAEIPGRRVLDPRRRGRRARGGSSGAAPRSRRCLAVAVSQQSRRAIRPTATGARPGRQARGYRTPVRVVPAPQPDGRADAVLLDDAELDRLRRFLSQEPARGDRFHRRRARGGTCSPSLRAARRPCRSACRCAGSGRAACTWRPGTCSIRRCPSRPGGSCSGWTATRSWWSARDGAYRLALSAMVPAWSLWLGEVPEPGDGISERGRELLAGLAPLTQVPAAAAPAPAGSRGAGQAAGSGAAAGRGGAARAAGRAGRGGPAAGGGRRTLPRGAALRARRPRVGREAQVSERPAGDGGCGADRRPDCRCVALLPDGSAFAVVAGGRLTFYEYPDRAVWSVPCDLAPALPRTWSGDSARTGSTCSAAAPPSPTTSSAAAPSRCRTGCRFRIDLSALAASPGRAVRGRRHRRRAGARARRPDAVPCSCCAAPTRRRRSAGGRTAPNCASRVVTRIEFWDVPDQAMLTSRAPAGRSG